MHCLAGDATGIVIAAAILPAFGLSNGWDATIDTSRDSSAASLSFRR
jgi:hypothetical protein